MDNMKIFCNDNLIDKESIAEIFEPGFLFGWGVFETLRAYKGKIPFLDLHIARLNDGLNTIGIEEVNIDFEKKIKELLKINKLNDAYIRITAYKKRESIRSTRPAKSRARSGLMLSKVEASTGILIYVDKFGYYQEEAYEKGFAAIVSPYKRNTECPFWQVKSLSFLGNRLSWFEAQKQNKDEALILNEKDFLVGGSRSNLFIVKNGEVITSPLSRGAFYGITRKIVINELKKMRIKLSEKEVTLNDLQTSDEAFLTSALLEVMPLVECGGVGIGSNKPGKVALQILTQYRKLCRT